MKRKCLLITILIAGTLSFTHHSFSLIDASRVCKNYQVNEQLLHQKVEAKVVEQQKKGVADAAKYDVDKITDWINEHYRFSYTCEGQRNLSGLDRVFQQATNWIYKGYRWVY